MTCDKSSDSSVPDSVMEMMPRELAEFVMERLSTAQQQPASLEHILYTLMENNNMDNLDLSECINVIKENCLLNDNNEPAVNDGENNTTPTSPPCTITTASDAANLNSSCETISNLSNHCQRHNIGSSNLENLLVVKQEPQDDNSNWLSPNNNATSNDFIMFNACNSFIQEVRKSRRFPCSRKNGRKTRHTNRLFDNQTTGNVNKYERRKWQNRAAAAKCRLKKRAHYQQTVAEFNTLEEEGKQLERQKDDLTAELNTLNQALASHHCLLYHTTSGS